MGQLKTLLVLFLLYTQTGRAHPVSYKNAIGIMSYNSANMTEHLLTYSLSPRFAVATEYLRYQNSEFYFPRINLLLKRWNQTESQANIYLSGSSGIEKHQQDSFSAHLVDFVADWESRKYYTYFQHFYLKRSNTRDLSYSKQDDNHTQLRLGFAPFLAEYNELNIWFIAQAENHYDQRPNDFTTFLRFYIRNVLWEIGAGTQGNLTFNFMIHL